MVILGDGTAIMVPYQHIIWFLECFVIPIFLLTFFKDIFQKHSWEFLTIAIGSIASLITLYLIINPDVNVWIRGSVILEPLDSTPANLFFRGFSIAESSSYGYGVIQGLFLAFCLFSIGKSILYIIPILPLLISILFNARIGFAVVIISMLFMITSKRIKFIALIIVLIIVLIAVFFVNNSSFVSDNTTSIEWGLNFFTDTFSFFRGESSGSNYDVLFNDMLFFPSTIFGVIFGEGRSAFGIVKGSDIGYVNQILTGGVFYLLMMFSFLWYMYKRNLKYATDKLYPTLFFITLLIVNIKGSAFFVSHSFFRLFTLYYIYCIFIADGKIYFSSDIEKKIKLE